MADFKLDYKKEYKDLYLPKTTPGIIDVPEINFIMVDGKGDPNTKDGEYQKAIELLYALCFTIKMSKLGSIVPKGYFEYVVPPLEGLWWIEEPSSQEDSSQNFSEKEKYCWTSMIRQPEFVTQDVFQWACGEVNRKKPHLDTSKARLQAYQEGLCIQILHIGLYDDEWRSIEQMDSFMKENNYQIAISDALPDGTLLRHHEIYLGDPRKVAPSKRKTVLRHPVKALLS